MLSTFEVFIYKVVKKYTEQSMWTKEVITSPTKREVHCEDKKEYNCTSGVYKENGLLVVSV